jgi:Tfp pilus assembly protein PilW
MIIRKNPRRGQTLIEALLALGVITMGLLGIMALLSKAFFYDREVSDRLTATYLASEGIEVAKNLIDHDMYSGAGWGACFESNPSWNSNGGGGFASLSPDYTTTDCASIPAYSGAPLLFDPATNRYGYSQTAGWAATAFTREVRVSLSGDQITVQSIVRWNTGPITGESVDLEDHFYDWRK